MAEGSFEGGAGGECRGSAGASTFTCRGVCWNAHSPASVLLSCRGRCTVCTLPLLAHAGVVQVCLQGSENLLHLQGSVLECKEGGGTLSTGDADSTYKVS